MNRIKITYFLLFLTFFLSYSFSDSEKDTVIASARNISYVENGSFQQKLDVYFQPGRKKLPVLVFIHGGAWLTGDKIITRPQARRMTERGFVFVSVNYRLSPFVMHPVHVLDCARAVLWIKNHIYEFGGDPDAIYIAGYSAGGHLCSLLACDPRYLDSVGLQAHQFKGYLIMGPGGMDLDRLAKNTKSRSIREEIFKSIFGERTFWPDACPTSHVSGNEPPLFVAVAEFDRLISRQDCLRFVDKSRRLGGDIRFFIIPGKTHLNAFLPFGREEDPLTLEVLSFIEAHR